VRQYRTGELGGAREQSTAASIVRVIIAGGSLPDMEVPTGSLAGAYTRSHFRST